MIDINTYIEQLNWHKEPYGLYEPIAYTLSGEGKRIRPRLCLLGALAVTNMSDEELQQRVLPAALALEVFHNFTLLHDDVMDRADTRRGRATVWKRWNENTAILSGDEMMIEAYKLLENVSADKLAGVFSMFNRMASEICEGQQLDMEYEKWKDEDCQMDDYIRMIRLKTAVLLATALKIGAYLANGTKQEQEALYQYGIKIGLAFQIQDDWLDCYGDKATFGKPIGGDIREGKKTWLRLSAVHHPNCQRDALISKDYDVVIAEYDRLGVKTSAVEAIQSLTHQAMKHLDCLGNNAITEQLKTIAINLINRTK